MIRLSDSYSVQATGEMVTDNGPFLQLKRQWSRPEFIHEFLKFCIYRIGVSTDLVNPTGVDDYRVKVGTVFRLIYLHYRIGIKGVASKPIHRLSRKANKLPSFKQLLGFLNICSDFS